MYCLQTADKAQPKILRLKTELCLRSGQHFDILLFLISAAYMIVD